MYQCNLCKNKNSLKDVCHFDCNGNQLDNTDPSFEQQAQNPDYAPYVICDGCMHDIVFEDKNPAVELGIIPRPTVVVKERRMTFEELYPPRPTGYEREWNRPF